MRLTKSKEEIVNYINSYDFENKLRDLITRKELGYYSGSSRELTPLEKSILDIVKPSMAIYMTNLVDSIYTQEEMEEDLSLK